MCGKDTSCGCSVAKQEAHNAAHPEDAAEIVQPVVTASTGVAVPFKTVFDKDANTLSLETEGGSVLAKGDIDDFIVAAGELDDITGLPTQWHGVLSVEGLRTTDHRVISPMALTWRQLPLAICAQFEDIHGLGDTPPSPIVGSITAIERDETTGYIMGEGTFDLTSEDGIKAARMCLNQTLRWNSVDLEILSSQYVEVSTDADMGGDDMLMDILLGDDIYEEPSDWYTEITEARIMKTTLVSTPAFPQCVVCPIDMALDIPEPMGTAPVVTPGLLASATMNIPDTPPASWFANPELQEPTPMEVTNDGRVFGHLALWDTCFAGETEFLTFGGIRTLKETVGTTQRVLTSTSGFGIANREEREFGGQWVNAEIKPFGVQSLMKVTLRRFGQEKVIYATPNHRWLVTPIGKEGYRHTSRDIVLTKDLEPGARLSPLFPKKRVTVGKGVRPSQFGVAHGITFGDGTRYRDGCLVDLFGEKDAQLLQYFSLSTNTATENPNGVPKIRVRNLPAFFKDMPSLNEGISYLYGWLAGYFAADGSVSRDGTPTMYSATKEHLEHYRDICSRLGIATSEIKTFERQGSGDYEGVPGKVTNNRLSHLHRMSLVASTLTPEFFLLAHHRQHFADRPNKRSYTAWSVVSVEETDRVEEVFCAVVPDHENFTLLDNINVMNCHVGFENVCVTPPRSEAQYRHFHTGTLACDNGDVVRVGHITFNTGHASMDKKANDAAYHYDHTGAVAADIVVGEDEFGIWFSGALRSSLDVKDIRAVRAAPLSGDWRKIGGGLELVAALSVNVPGFNITAGGGQRQGEQVSLVAAAVKRRDPMKEMAKEIAMLRRSISPLMSQSIVQLKERVNGKPQDRSVVLASLRERIAG